MNLDLPRLETAWQLAVSKLDKQIEFPAFVRKRWATALTKAKERLIEQPYFSWQSNRLMLVSPPNAKETECKFYEASAECCRRFDRIGLCQAFYEGFPCWHRAAFLLLQIYHGEFGENFCSRYD